MFFHFLPRAASVLASIPSHSSVSSSLHSQQINTPVPRSSTTITLPIPILKHTLPLFSAHTSKLLRWRKLHTQKTGANKTEESTNLPEHSVLLTFLSYLPEQASTPFPPSSLRQQLCHLRHLSLKFFIFPPAHMHLHNYLSVSAHILSFSLLTSDKSPFFRLKWIPSRYFILEILI